MCCKAELLKILSSSPTFLKNNFFFLTLCALVFCLHAALKLVVMLLPLPSGSWDCRDVSCLPGPRCLMGLFFFGLPFPFLSFSWTIHNTPTVAQHVKKSVHTASSWEVCVWHTSSSSSSWSSDEKLIVFLVPTLSWIFSFDSGSIKCDVTLCSFQF